MKTRALVPLALSLLCACAPQMQHKPGAGQIELDVQPLGERCSNMIIRIESGSERLETKRLLAVERRRELLTLGEGPNVLFASCTDSSTPQRQLLEGGSKLVKVTGNPDGTIQISQN